MSVKVEARGSDQAVVEQRHTWANRVINKLKVKLSDQRLLVFLSDNDELKEGEVNRGWFSPLRCKYDFQSIPNKTRVLGEMLWTSSMPTYNYDALIYVRNHACLSEDSLTMTLAHELRHFIQYASDWKTWARNSFLLSTGAREFRKARELASYCIPVEHEARLEAKRVCESFFGTDRTSKYIKSRRDQGVDDTDVADWELILGIKTSDAYNCASETRSLFKRLAPYRGELQKILKKMQDDGAPDVKYLDLEELMSR